MKKKLLLFIMIATLACGLCACGSTADSKVENSAQSEGIRQNEDVKSEDENSNDNQLVINAVGDEVIFGSYYYDKNETQKSIEWTVIDIQGDKALLLSNSVLDAKKNYDVDDDGYMNMLANRMFSDEEKKQIITEVWDGQDGSSYIFLLNSAEVDNYLPERENELRKACATEYAINEGVTTYESMSGYYVNWALRDGKWVGGQTGNMGKICDTKVHYDYGIRPAMWIQIP